MTSQPSQGSAPCPECQEIAHQMGEAMALRRSEHETASDALASLVGGTEDDMARAEELLRPFRSETNPGMPKIPEALHGIMTRAALHAMRTGHFVRPFPPR